MFRKLFDEKGVVEDRIRIQHDKNRACRNSGWEPENQPPLPRNASKTDPEIRDREKNTVVFGRRSKPDHPARQKVPFPGGRVLRKAEDNKKTKEEHQKKRDVGIDIMGVADMEKIGGKKETRPQGRPHFSEAFHKTEKNIN